MAWQALAAGAALGALGGLMPDSREDRMRRVLQQYRPLMKRLEDQASGEGSSLAEEQMRRALGRTAGQMQGMAAAARPGQNQALARRYAMQQGAKLQAEQAGQGALLRLQEQQMANQMLAQLRAQDLGVAEGLNRLPTRWERILGGAQGGMQVFAQMPGQKGSAK